ELPDHRLQEPGLLPIAFDQRNFCSIPLLQQYAEYDAWQSAARAKIEPGLRIGRQCQELSRIEDVAPPRIRCRGRRHEVDALVPAQQRRLKRNQLLKCFT